VDARVFLLLMGGLLLGDAALGLALMRAQPGQAGLVAIAGAVAMALGVTFLAWRAPRLVAPGCAACGCARDPELAFCARCGFALTSRLRSP